MERKSKNNLSGFELFLSGGALFSMHFGASSMVWPMNWGKESGISVFLAFFGAFITSILLVFIAYLALSKGEGSFSKLTNKVLGKKLGNIYTGITIAVLGPFYVIPRMSAAAWDSFLNAFGLNPASNFPLIIFTILFYLLTYFFLTNPGKEMEKISNLLFPFLLAIVIFIVIKGSVNPISTPVEKIYSGSALAYGFTNGYATAEILCALIFGMVIVNNLEEKGIEKEYITENMIKVGIVGLSMLTFAHFAHMWIGAHTGKVFEDLSYTALYTAVARKLYGKIGGILFSLALFFAALTTAIGMTSGCARFFVEDSEGRCSYKKASIAILILSVVFGSLGLSKILDYLGPILDGVYPAAIVLVLFFALASDTKSEKYIRACRFSMLTAMVFGFIDTIWKYMTKAGLDPLGLVSLYEKIPLAKSSLLWIAWTILFYIIALLTYREERYY